MALLLASACVAPAVAAENEKDSGFFSYFPAAPDLNLPKLDIVPFWSSDLKKARKAYNSRDYGTALAYFRKASEDGNLVADWYLGNMYRMGRGMPRNDAIAYSYYSRVAESYDPDEDDANRRKIVIDSQLQLTNYLRSGVADAQIKPDPAAAARNYLRLASNYGHPTAMFELGVMNIKGQGVTSNPPQGLKWLIAAARKRSPEAEAYLGELYWKGEFVRRDETRALMWYALASQTASKSDFMSLHTRHSEIREQVSEDTRLEADARARIWAEQYPAAKN
jgi:uncharacterized protein